MNVNEHTSIDINIHGGYGRPPYTGLIPEVQMPVLAENSQTGVSTKNALLGTAPKTVKRKPKEVSHWYALRVTYGRERMAYDYMIGTHVEASYPTITTIKIVDGKRKSVEESRLPNIFFAHGTEEDIKSFVYDNVNLPYLRFYYRHFLKGGRIIKEPLTVPDYQIESLKIICAAEAADILIVPDDVRKFEERQSVRIIEGQFKGVVGKVARYHDQQRVRVVIDGIVTAITAYIPNAFLEKTE